MPCSVSANQSISSTLHCIGIALHPAQALHVRPGAMGEQAAKRLLYERYTNMATDSMPCMCPARSQQYGLTWARSASFTFRPTPASSAVDLIDPSHARQKPVHSAFCNAAAMKIPLWKICAPPRLLGDAQVNHRVKYRVGLWWTGFCSSIGSVRHRLDSWQFVAVC